MCDVVWSAVQPPDRGPSAHTHTRTHSHTYVHICLCLPVTVRETEPPPSQQTDFISLRTTISYLILCCTRSIFAFPKFHNVHSIQKGEGRRHERRWGTATTPPLPLATNPYFILVYTHTHTKTYLHIMLMLKHSKHLQAHILKGNNIASREYSILCVCVCVCVCVCILKPFPPSFVVTHFILHISTRSKYWDTDIGLSNLLDPFFY